MIIKPKRRETDFTPTSFVHSVPLHAATEPFPRNAEFDALQERVLRARDTGDWLAWFVDVSAAQEEVFQAYGHTKDVRAAVVDPLKKLFPPRACLELLKHKRNHRIVSGLFSASLLDVVTLIRLGNKLVRVRRWPDKNLVSALRSVEGFAAASTELDVWGNLEQGGFRFDREPRGPDGKLADFAVYFNAWRYIVEVKTIRPGDSERLAKELSSAMSSAGDNWRRPGLHVQIQATSELGALLEDIQGRTVLVDRAPEELERLAEEGRRMASMPDGDIAVGDWFRVRVTVGADHPDGIVATAVWEGPEDARRAVRIASVVEGALLQIPPAAMGVVLVDVGDAIRAEVVREELLRRAAEQAVLFGPLQFVILRWHRRVSPFRSEAIVVTVPIRRAVLPSETQLAIAMAS